MNRQQKWIFTGIFFFILVLIMACELGAELDNEAQTSVDAGASEPPSSYQTYFNDSQGITIYYPDGWAVKEENDNGLTLLPNTEPADEPKTYAWVLFPDNMLQPEPASDTPLDDAISTLLFYLRNEDITPTGSIQKNDDRATLHFEGAMEGRSVEGIVAAVREGDDYVGLFGFTDDEMMTPVFLSIVDHLQIKAPTHSPSDGALSLVPGQALREDKDTVDGSRDYRFTANQGDEYLLVVMGQRASGIHSYKVFDPHGKRIVRDDYVTDFTKSVKHLANLEAGDYSVTVDEGDGAILLLLPIEPDAPSTLSVSSANLAQKDVVELTYEDIPGDWIVIYAEATGPEADERSINLEFFLDDRMILENHPPPLEGARIVERVAEDHTYMLRIYETDGQAMDYSLYVFSPDI